MRDYSSYYSLTKNDILSVFQGNKAKPTNNNKNAVAIRIKPDLNRRKGNLEKINDLLGVCKLPSVVV